MALLHAPRNVRQILAITLLMSPGASGPVDAAITSYWIQTITSMEYDTNYDPPELQQRLACLGVAFLFYHNFNNQIITQFGGGTGQCGTNFNWSPDPAPFGFMWYDWLCTWEPHNGAVVQTQLWQETGIYECQHEYILSWCYGATVQTVTYEVVFKGPGSMGFWTELEAWLPELPCGGDKDVERVPLTRQGTIITCNESTDFSGVWTNGVETCGINATYDAQEEKWEGEIVYPVSAGSVDYGTVTVVFRDSQVDVNEDGRFSWEDVDALEVYLGEEPPEEHLFWDFDQDGEITESDQNLMEHLLDAGQGSGLFGDLDGDDGVTLDDYELACGSFGMTLDDGENYLVQLDYDLDGVVDNADLLALREAAIGSSIEADVDGDADVDQSDLGLLLASFNKSSGEQGFDARGDLNCDCTVNNQDLGILLPYLG